MENGDKKDLEFEQTFDINKVSFDKVNRDFENKFKQRYSSSLSMMSDSKDHLKNASGASSLGILEKMGNRIGYYDKTSDFEKSYEDLQREYEAFSET